MCMLQRFYNAVMVNRERKRAKLKVLLTRAMMVHPNYAGGWDMGKLIEKILEITDG